MRANSNVIFYLADYVEVKESIFNLTTWKKLKKEYRKSIIVVTIKKHGRYNLMSTFIFCRKYFHFQNIELSCEDFELNLLRYKVNPLKVNCVIVINCG